MRINSVPDVKCFCNNKNVLRAQSMVWHFLRHPVWHFLRHPVYGQSWFQNFLHAVNVVFFLLGDSPEPEFYVLTFRNTLFHFLCSVSHSSHFLWRWNRQSVPKVRHMKVRPRGITQKKEYNVYGHCQVRHRREIITHLSVGFRSKSIYFCT